MKKLFLFLMAYVLMLNVAYASTLTAEGKYTKRNTDTITYAEEQAFLNAQDEATRKLGVYIKTTKTVRNYRLTDQQILEIAPHLMKVVSKTLTHEYTNEGKLIVHCIVTSEVDDNIDRYIVSEVDNENLRKENIKLRTEVEELKKIKDSQNASVTNASQRAYVEGKMYWDNFRTTDALVKFKTSVELDGHNRWGWIYYFKCLRRNQQYDELENACYKSLECMPDFGDAYVYLGELAMPEDEKLFMEHKSKRSTYYKSDAKKAIKLFKQALDLHTDNRDVYGLLAIAYAQTENWDLAFYNADYASQAYSDNPLSWYAYAKVCMYHGDYQNALMYYKNSLEYHPNYGPSRGEIGLAYYAVGDIKNAYMSFNSYYNFLSTHRKVDKTYESELYRASSYRNWFYDMLH